MVTVHKFGGGILRDAKSYGRAADILQTQGPGQLAVVSALYGVTDQLDDAAKNHSGNHVDEFTRQLLDRHLELMHGIQNQAVQKDAAHQLVLHANRLTKILYGIYLLDELTPRTLDLVHSFGERLSAHVLHAHVLDRGIPSKCFEADAAGLVTNDRFANAVPDFEKTAINLQRTVGQATQDGVAVFTGYFGINPNGHVTTLGRGGSDFSAGIVAYALDAQRLVVWKDVAGFMSADPKIVPEARLIPLLSYDEAEELGAFGAKILHPKTMAPLRLKRIPVEIRSVFEPDHVGSRIAEEGKKADTVAKAVAVKHDACIVTIQGGSLSDVSSVAYLLFERLRHEDLPIDAISTSQSDLSLCFDKKFLAKFQKALGQANVSVRDVSIQSNAGLLGLVGEGMNHTPGVSKRLFATLADSDINVRMICQGASEINITVALSATDVDKALKAVHAEFIEQTPLA